MAVIERFRFLRRAMLRDNPANVTVPVEVIVERPLRDLCSVRYLLDTRSIEVFDEPDQFPYEQTTAHGGVLGLGITRLVEMY